MSDTPAGSDALRRGSPLAGIDEACDRFEAAWKSGREPRIDDYLPVGSHAEGSSPRRQLLIELVIIDLEYRWRSAAKKLREHSQRAEESDQKGTEEPPSGPFLPLLYLEDYSARYPELGPLDDLPEELVAHHSRVRQQWGDGPRGLPGLAGLTGCMDEFKGTRRFVVERRIGAGGMGVVYQAFDRQRKELVAIKTVRTVEARSIYRLKREFRALADLVHPNLVTLHELFSIGGQWFFTMEFVEGSDFLSYVRSGMRWGEADWPAEGQSGSALTEGVMPAGKRSTVRPYAGDVDTDRTFSALSKDTGGWKEAPPPSPLAPAQLARLRRALKQIAEGVSVLHQAGKLHRDVKPSNVLVTHEGRVVLLDFGLATELERREQTATTGNNVVGSVPYMSPEQAVGKRLSRASDWYSVGVMLYEALTGRQPFEGRALDVLTIKQEKDPPPPSELVVGVPEDLNWLCMGLLRRDPATRPSGEEVLRRLGSVPADQEAPPHAPSSSLGQAPFVGREEHLNVLSDAFRVMERGRTVVAYVHGRSGVGKTALVERFLDQVRQRDDSVILAGRCHESESVPYKALDSLVDGLSHYLVRLPRLEVEALLPRDVEALSRVFPVLRRVEAVAQSPRLVCDVPDRHELRQRAVDGLRELLARIGDRRMLVLHIDDLHWGDLDSVAMLSDLLLLPHSPVLLLVLSYRAEQRTTDPLLHAILELHQETSQCVDVCEIEVDPLNPVEARQLACALIGGDDPGTERLGEAIARESGGSPYFVEALVRHQEESAQLPNGSLSTEVASLDEILWDRVSSLPDPARRLLETVSVAGHPVRQEDAFQAAGLSTEGHEALGVLRMTHMIHVGGESLEDRIEAYDERVRKTVTAHVSPRTAAGYHQRLAVALEAAGGTDPAMLAAHYVGAEAPQKAGQWYAVAADQAADALAFDRATELYRLAIQLSYPFGGAFSCPTDGRAGALERNLRRRLADSLANAGRGAEAAKEYLRAAGGANAAEGLELRRRAAMQFLTSGRIDEGLAALRTVLAAVGMKLPKTPRRAFCSLLLRRAKVRLRGVEFRQRDSSRIPPRDLRRIDICWSAALGLSIVDTVYAAGFHTQGLLLSLRSGEPYRIARSLALEATYAAFAGGRARRRVERLLDQATTLAQRVDNPHAAGVVSMAAGVAACLEGRWQRAVELSDQAEKTFRQRCTGVAWEIDTTQVCALSALFWCGQVAELARRLPLALPEAKERGDFSSLASLARLNLPQLAANDPDGAERELREAAAECTERGFHLQRFHQLYAQVQIDVYRGDGASARCLIAQQWPALARSLLMRVQLFRVMIYDARARSALAAAAGAIDPKPLVRAAERNARRLEREKEPWVKPLAEVIRAAVAAFDGDNSKATTLLMDAIIHFDAADMPLRAASARHRLGELIGGHSGNSLVAETDSWMAGQRIVVPSRMAALFAPAFPT